MKPLIIYHDNCADGIVAMLCAKQKFGEEAEYFPCNYQAFKIVEWADNAPITGLEYKNYRTVLDKREVYFVDFSMPRNMLNEVAKVATKVVVLDHHKTAREELMLHIPADTESDTPHPEHWQPHPDLAPNIEVHFDMESAGCWLAWDYFRPGFLRPAALHIVGLRDLWQHKGTPDEEMAEDVNLALTTIPYSDVENWEVAVMDTDYFSELVEQGRAIRAWFNQRISEAQEHYFLKDVYIAHGSNPVEDWHFNCAVVNAPYFMASELGNRLAKQCDCALVWMFTKDGLILCSFRSVGDFDVSRLAKIFGGGGHKNAAGCKMTLATFAENFLK